MVLEDWGVWAVCVRVGAGGGKWRLLSMGELGGEKADRGGCLLGALLEHVRPVWCESERGSE